MSVPVYINTRAFGEDLLKQHGHSAIVHLTQTAGASGIDIAPSWFALSKEKILSLSRVIAANHLQASAISPVSLCLGNQLHPQLSTIFAQAQNFGVHTLKLRLGLGAQDKPANEIWTELQKNLPSSLHISLINGHEPSEGSIDVLKNYLNALNTAHVKVSLNFDLANWALTGIHPNDAAAQLGSQVSSIQCRGTREENHQLSITVPSVVNLAEWSSFWSRFPKLAIRCLDFPLDYGELDSRDLEGFEAVAHLWLQRLTHLA